MVDHPLSLETLVNLPKSGGWKGYDRRSPKPRTMMRRVGHYRRSGSPAERQQILTLWAGLTPWSAYWAQRRTQSSGFPRSWMARVLMALG